MKPHIRLHAESDGFSRRSGRTAYDGASITAHDVASWTPTRKSADAEILPEWGTLVARSRDIDRNNPIAKGARQTIIDNVVGTGPRLLPEPDYATLEQTPEWAVKWSEEVESMFHAWWWSTACHAGDTLCGDQLVQQAQAAQIMNGEAITLPLWLPERGDGYATKLQMIEADRLSNPNGAPDTQFRRGGIEFDAYGMPLAYHIKKTHPGDYLLNGTSLAMFDWERIPRRTEFGRLRVLHFYDQERSPQSRGKPLMTTILPELKNIDRYKRAEIDAAVANALIAGIITTPLERDDVIELFSKDAVAYLKARQEHAVRLQSGSLMSLFPGDDFKSHIPGRPNSQFGTFTKNILQIAACGLDMPYELLTKDWSNTTYTSGRMALLEAWRSFNRRRDLIGTQWLDPVYALWFEEQFYAGNIDAPGFDEDPVQRTAYLRCQWIFPGRGWVDEVKEAEGAASRLRSRISTLAKECAQQGLYWRDVMRQQAVEIAFAKENGMPDPFAAPAPAAQQAQQTDPPPEQTGNQQAQQRQAAMA